MCTASKHSVLFSFFKKILIPHIFRIFFNFSHYIYRFLLFSLIVRHSIPFIYAFLSFFLFFFFFPFLFLSQFPLGTVVFITCILSNRTWTELLICRFLHRSHYVAIKMGIDLAPSIGACPDPLLQNYSLMFY